MGKLDRKKSKIDIHPYIPAMYNDRVSEDKIDIPDLIGLGIYRYYGIHIDSDLIGFIKYHVYFEGNYCEIEQMKIKQKYRNQGYGSKLLKKSLDKLINDLPFINSIRILPTASSKNFFQRHGFKTYIDDDRYVKILHGIAPKQKKKS